MLRIVEFDGVFCACQRVCRFRRFGDLGAIRQFL